jgi:hypothetical protein
MVSFLNLMHWALLMIALGFIFNAVLFHVYNIFVFIN